MQYPDRNQSAKRQKQHYDLNPVEIIHAAWQTKWRVLIALVLVAVIYTAVTAIGYLGEVKATRYHQVFDLTFEGLSEGRFPDGSPFILSDIINDTVLFRVYQKHSLQAQGLSLDEFYRAVNVEPLSPDYFGIIDRYRQQLASSNSSATDIRSLEERMRRDLRVAQSGSVRLSLQLPLSREMAPTLARTVLEDIATTWAARAIEERGVLRLNLPIYSARIFDETRFEALDYLIGIELLLENIQLIQANVDALKAQPNSASVVDQDSGLNLEDLEKSIRDVARYDLRQLIDPVKELGLTRNREVVRLFYNRQLQELDLDMRFWEKKADITRAVLASYTGNNSGGGSSDSSADTNIENRQDGQRLTNRQLGDPFLDRLIDISRQGTEESFRQSLSQLVLGYENDALDVRRKMEGITLTLNAIGTNGNDQTLHQTYLEQVEVRLPNVLATLREYTDIIGRLHHQLGLQAAGNVSTIIMAQNGSFTTVTNRPVDRETLRVFIALMFLTGLGALFASLIHDLVKARRTTTPQP